MRVVEAVRRLPQPCRFGIHFHMASSNIGVQHWRHLFSSMLRWCRSIQKLSGRELELLDLGGGWFPDDAQSADPTLFREAVKAVSEQLPSIREVITEPGKALAQPSTALAMQILEVRRMSDARCEAVVDASIAELPMHFFHPHRILYKGRKSDVWRQLGRGKAALLGRLCMEHDIVANEVGLPDDAQAGDYLIFCDAGAYDRSMSYVFGRG